MSVKQAILDFTDGEIRNKIFVTPDIPAKKLSAARSQFISRDEEVIVLYDDTVFGSAKDGIAITENYIYAKQLWEVPKSIKISSIRSIASQSKSLNNLEIYLNGNLFITVSPPEKADHAFLIGILRAAKDAAAKPEKNKGRAAPAAEAPSPLPARSAPEAKSRSDASEEMRSCEECRAVLPTGAKFCLECGTKVMPKGICLECNAKLPEKARFCPECGTPAGKALAKAAEPKVDTAALRAELASWLSSAEQDASIDNDGDLTVSLNSTAPAFAKDFRGWVAQYDLKISSEGVTEEISDSSFYGRDEEFFIRSPYRRVGKLASASYELATKLQVYTLQELEIHEIVLKDGALSIPKLGSTQVKIKTLSARRDDDGSYGVEYELEAYPNHVVHFEVLREKPDEEGGVWARVQEEDTQSGTSWLWDVEPGQKVYACFGEYKLLVDGIEATLSGTAEPAGGAYDDANDQERGHSPASQNDGAEIGKTYSVENETKKTFIEVISLQSPSGHSAIRRRIYRFGLINVTITNDDERENFNNYISENCDFDTDLFSSFELDHCDDLIEDDWWFENASDDARYKNIQIPNDFYDLLDFIENEAGYQITSLNYEISDGGINVSNISSATGPSVSGSKVGSSQSDVRSAILSALEGALTKFANDPPKQAFSGGDCYFVWQIILKDGNGQDLTSATGDDFAVHCDLDLLEDVVIHETESMTSVLEDIRERFNQFLSDTNEEVVFGASDAISFENSEFFVYVCEVAGGGADVFRYYGEHFPFDQMMGSAAQASGVSKFENQNGMDWREAADRAFNAFFNAIRKGEDTDTAAERFRGEISAQTAAAGIEYEFGWADAITPAQLRIISDVVANRLRGLNEEQGYQISSDFYQGFISSFSNIIHWRSQEGEGDFEALQTYWDQEIGNELPEECGMRLPGQTAFAHQKNEKDIPKDEIASYRNKLAAMSSRLEEKFISNGKIANFFHNCENLYISIYLDLDPMGSTLIYEVIVETDGYCEDVVDTQEDILDYISDHGLSAGLEEIFGDRNVTDDTVWNVHIRPLQN